MNIKNIILQLLPFSGIKLLWLQPHYYLYTMQNSTNIKEKEESKFLEKKDKYFAMTVTTQNFQIIKFLIFGYNSDVSIQQYQYFIKGSQLIGFDSISKWQIFLINLIIPIVIKDSWGTIKSNRREFLIKVLFVNFWSILVFIVKDLLLFYISFEAILIPMYFLIGYYGSRNKKIEEAQNKFFIYTQIGSLFLLIAIQSIWYQTGTTDYELLINMSFNKKYELWLFLAFFLAFAIKTPKWPFHIWLPVAHGESSTGTSVILAAILLKQGKPLCIMP